MPHGYVTQGGCPELGGYMKKSLKHNYDLYDIEPINDFQSMVFNTAQRTPDRIAFRYVLNKEDKTVTFKEHLENMQAFGTALANKNVLNMHVAMVGDNSYEWILSQITILGSNNVFVPVDKELPLLDLLNVINHSDSEVVICTGKFIDCLIENKESIPNVSMFICFNPKNALPEGVYDGWELINEGRKLFNEGNIAYTSLKPDDSSLAEIVYTSGTTGAPKGVMLSKHNLKSSVYYSLQTMEFFHVCLSVLPYNHTYESTCDLLVSQHYGTTVCINDNLKNVAANFKKYNPEHVMLVPLFVETFYKKIWKTIEKEGKADQLNKLIKISNNLRKVGIDLRTKFFKPIRDIFGENMKMIVVGGAPIRPELADFFDSIGISLNNGYGITECSPLLSCNRLYYNNYKSVGVPLKCVQLRIEDPNEAGEGEIIVKGDIVTMGYYKNVEATKEVLTDDGWFSTGDYGKMVGDQLFITGRKKNLIVLQNGKNIYPEEIEDYLAGIEGVEEVIVYGLKDNNGDETGLCAEIYPSQDFAQGKSDDELIKYFKTNATEVCRPLPAYKNINAVVIRHKEFPHTTSKKIKRQEVYKERPEDK